MISDLELARLCEESYTAPATYERADVHATLRAIGGVNVVTFRGSDNLIAWWRDFLVLGHDTYAHPELGPVHAGMFGDVMQVLEQIEADVGGDLIALSGHSKGAGEAQICAALRLLRKRPVLQVTTFGAPRIGKLGSLLAEIPGTDYRHARDPVPLFPIGFGHPRAITQLGAEGVEDLLDPISDHFIAGYVAALPA